MGGNRSRKVLLVAEESAGVQLLRRLIASDIPVAGVLTSAPREAVRGASVLHLARASGLDVWPAESVRDPAFANEIRRREIDLLLNVHSLYRIRPEIVEAPRIGSFNLHPGPLPRYAGLNAPSWAVLNGERTFGVTLHWMDAGLDTGPIACQRSFPLGPRETGLSVAARCIREGLVLLDRLLRDAAEEPPSIPRRSQDRSQRTYFGRKVPDGGLVDWHRPVRELDAFIRAADYHPLPSPWGHPRARLGDEPLGIVKAEPVVLEGVAAPGTVDRTPDRFAVACADGWLALRLVHFRGRYGRPEDLLPDVASIGPGAG